MRRTVELFKALADETRLRILSLLSDGELCVCEITKLLDVSQPNISRHLAYLRRANLVTMRQDGKWKYYAIPKKPADLHRTLLSCVRGCLRQIDTLRGDLSKLREARKHDKCS